MRSTLASPRGDAEHDRRHQEPEAGAAARWRSRLRRGWRFIRSHRRQDPLRGRRIRIRQVDVRQRAMIAMALALEPAVLVADEPTTALDVTTQAQILKLIRDLQRRRNMAVMFITHDFGVVAEIADRVVVLQHGKVVEQGTADDVLLRAQHPYTRALLAAVPTLQPPQRTPLLDRSKAVEVIGLGKTYISAAGSRWCSRIRSPRSIRAGRSATSSPMGRSRMASIRQRRESVPVNSSAWSASMRARWNAFRMNSPADSGSASG